MGGPERPEPGWYSGLGGASKAWHPVSSCPIIPVTRAETPGGMGAACRGRTAPVYSSPAMQKQELSQNPLQQAASHDCPSCKEVWGITV